MAINMTTPGVYEDTITKQLEQHLKHNEFRSLRLKLEMLDTDDWRDQNIRKDFIQTHGDGWYPRTPGKIPRTFTEC